MPAIIQSLYLRFFALLTLLLTLLKSLQRRCDDSHSVVVQSPNRVWLFATPWTAAHQASLSFSVSQSLFKLMSFELAISSVQSLSHVQLFATPWSAAHQASLSITNSWSLLKIMSIASMMPSNHLILCLPPFLLPSIFPSIRVFSNKSVLCIRWPKYWSFNSASVLPMNIQGGFPLGLPG